MDINNEINREKTCINDLLKYIEIHTKEGRYDLAQARANDIVKSLNQIKSLEALRMVKQVEKEVV